MIKTKSIYYDDKEPDDGTRILVMRRWPRGISKDQIDEWCKDLGPSVELLRQWNHGEIAFTEFRERYLAEMQDKAEEVQERARRARTETITLLCHEESEDHCHRKILKRLIERHIATKRGKPAMQIQTKQQRYALNLKVVRGKSGTQYLFIKAPDGSYHAFTEVVAKHAARDCGATKGNTRRMCEQVLGF